MSEFGALIGICVGHGEWFSLDGRKLAACPHPGCGSDIYLYERLGATNYLSPLEDEPHDTDCACDPCMGTMLRARARAKPEHDCKCELRPGRCNC
jgi:hypothetical protein